MASTPHANADRVSITGLPIVVRLAVVIAVLATVLAAAETASAQSVSLAEIARRDWLVGAQEELLNVYRCQFNIDTHLSPGGCIGGTPGLPAEEPQPFAGTPTAEELARRDWLVGAQEELLNVYRCQFNIDTLVVPGGCGAGAPEPTSVPIVLPTPTAEDDPTPTAQDEDLSPAEVYALVSPSIALVETSSKLGSGILIEGSYIVTNHHVVWPYDEAWLVFPDGTEFQDVPVIGRDFIADLAVLGPIDVPHRPLAFSDRDDLATGSELLLVGYPSEPELFPQPTITRGILSRLREWSTYNLTLLQSDAAIAGGQSGGALLNSRGEVVGISTWRFSEAGFALATSAADDALIVERLINSYEPSEFKTERRGPRKFGDFEHQVTGTQGIDSPAFTFNATAGTKVTITIKGKSNGVIIVSDAVRTLVTEDDTKTGVEETTFEVLRSGNHFVRINSESDGEFDFELTSTVRLHPYRDELDGTTLLDRRDLQVFYGWFDYAFDTDWFKISLEEDEVIEISTDSILADTTIAVRNRETGETEKSENIDPNTGLGFSTNAHLRFTAPEAGDYAIYIDERSGGRDISYILTVQRVQQ